MTAPAPVSWQDLVEDLRHKLEETFERLADAIKDALLDWGCEGDFVPPTCPAAPPSRDELVAALRERAEETLQEVAAVLAAAGDEAGVAAARARVEDLFSRLAGEALQFGWGPSAGPESGEGTPAPPRGEWARRYRRMHAAADAFSQEPQEC